MFSFLANVPEEKASANRTADLVLSKLPQVTLTFWIIKIFATTLGEVGGNAVTMTLGFGYLVGTIVFGAALLVLLVVQIRSQRFNPFLYWAVITATTLTGTTLADFCDRSLGIGYLGGSLTLFTLVVATLALWRWSLGSIAVESVNSPKAESFYWAAIMFSQTLGTASDTVVARSRLPGRFLLSQHSISSPSCRALCSSGPPLF
jgi:uncharacterized membrane-anchored protein